MAISTIGTQLLYGATESALKELCRIKDYPDLMGEPNLIDTTDLTDTQDTNIQGTKTSDVMAFTANYDKTVFKTVNDAAGTEQYYAVRFSDGSGVVWKGSHTCGLSGKGVNDPVEFTINITNSTPVEPKETITVSDAG